MAVRPFRKNMTSEPFSVLMDIHFPSVPCLCACGSRRPSSELVVYAISSKRDLGPANSHLKHNYALAERAPW